jgi:hypothetical protein
MDYLKDWGVASYDWSNANAIWHADQPNDCDVKMVDQAAAAKRTAPSTKIWIYRNLAQAYAEFVQIREKLEDPLYSGWFLRFGANNDEKNTPRCTFNKRLNKSLCSDLFHWKGQRPGGDCGDKIPCGWYVWDHRNASLRTWLVDEFMMGTRYGLGNESVDGFLIDDWWTLDGPTETNGFFGGTNLPHKGTEIADIYSNWTVTTNEALQRIRDGGGFTWNNVNCELDHSGGYGGLAEVMPPCGLTKTEGYPQADNVESIPTRAENVSSAREPSQCIAWHRAACSDASILPTIPLLLSFTRGDSGKQFPLPSPLQDIASFLLVRGPYAWMGYGWLGCISEYERPAALSYEYGTPVGTCRETGPGSGVFTRTWTQATVSLDCNSWSPTINITAGPSAHGVIPLPSVPPSPSPGQPTPAPAPMKRCDKSRAVAGYTCTTGVCNNPDLLNGGSSSPDHYSPHPAYAGSIETGGQRRGGGSSNYSSRLAKCGADLCWPKATVPGLCAPLPPTMEDAISEAARRCTGYQLCKSFAINSAWKPGTSESDRAKYWANGGTGLNRDSVWSTWIQES